MKSFATSSEPQVLFEDLNRVISELIAAKMFVTLAFVSLAKSNDLHFATAGHLPILHFRSATGSVCELHSQSTHWSLQRAEVREFSRGIIKWRYRGSLDGRADRSHKWEEYGLERVKQQVTKHCEESLKVLCEMLLGEASKFGKQMDDQSVLLVRRL